MARKNKPTPSESGEYLLRARYSALWRALQNITQTGGASPEQSIIAAHSKDEVVVETRKDCCLELLGVPVKARFHTGIVDVHVSFRQTVGFQGSEPVVKTSNVKVTYLQAAVPSKECRVLETWHFDYAPDVRAHPIFHVQLTDDHLLHGPTMRKYGKSHRTPDLRDAPRVPCAPMDLPAVAALLVYDHFPDRLERLDDTEWVRAVSALPSLPWSHFRKQGWQKSPEARCWYPQAPA